ncbi:MAG: hypothetical protein ACXVPN_16470 [Bacteroidia bacterium]
MANRSYRKPLIFVVLIFTALSVVSWIFLKPQGPHGGVVKRADNYFIEMKSEEKAFSAYIFDKKFKAIEIPDIHGKVKFYFRGSADINVPLNLSTKNEFKCIPPIGYYSCKVMFTIMGKPVSANFFNPMQIVMQK